MLQKPPGQGKGHRVGGGQGTVNGCIPLAGTSPVRSFSGSSRLSLRHQLSRGRGNGGRAGIAVSAIHLKNGLRGCPVLGRASLLPVARETQQSTGSQAVINGEEK